MNKDFADTKTAFESLSDTELRRAYVLFKMVGYRRLVRCGGRLMSLAFRYQLPVSWALKWSIFKQFCGGESLEDCRVVIKSLRERRVSAILDYGVEGEKSETGFNLATEEIIRTSQEAASNPAVAFIVFKFTAIAPFDLLERVSKASVNQEINSLKLSASDLQAWQKVQARVNRIIQSARSANKPLMIDAEETWIQDAIDSEALRLMRTCNKDSAQVYTTFQMYRRDSLARIKDLHEIAKLEGFHLGIKLVRGAYIDKERARATDMQYADPIHPTKKATDTAYDEALQFILTHIQRIALCAGTHNEASSSACLKWFANAHQNDRQKLWCSQLYGMSDHITFNLAKQNMNVVKYVPYGPVAAVIPYLIRRAEENTSVEGQAGRELTLISEELQRRSRKLS